MKEKESSPQRLRAVFSGMKRRCYNPNDKRYKDYGGRGIKICKEWLNDTNKFIEWAFENGYTEDILPNGVNKWTIDRIDNNGNYEPNNCRWVDRFTQARNKRSNHKVIYNEKEMSLKELSEIIGMNYYTLHSRLSKKVGWNLEMAIKIKPHSYSGQFSDSGYKYVYPDSHGYGYKVIINKRYIGCRKTLDEAIALRDKTLKELESKNVKN